MALNNTGGVSIVSATTATTPAYTSHTTASGQDIAINHPASTTVTGPPVVSGTGLAYAMTQALVTALEAQKATAALLLAANAPVPTPPPYDFIATMSNAFAVAIINHLVANAFAPRRIPEDANTLLSWTLDEQGVHPNAGNGGALTLTETGNTASLETGIFGQCVEFGPLGNGIMYSPSTDIVPTATAFTLNMWVYLRGFTGSGTIFTKCHHATWTAPYGSIYVVEHDSLGNWDVYFVIGGVLVGPYTAGDTPPKGKIPLNIWTMLTVTFSSAAGGTVTMYTNGSMAYQLTGIGTPVDFNTVASSGSGGGPYTVGLTVSNVNPLLGMVDDIRLLNGVLSPSAIRTMYDSAMSLT